MLLLHSCHHVSIYQCVSLFNDASFSGSVPARCVDGHYTSVVYVHVLLAFSVTVYIL